LLICIYTLANVVRWGWSMFRSLVVGLGSFCLIALAVLGIQQVGSAASQIQLATWQLPSIELPNLAWLSGSQDAIDKLREENQETFAAVRRVLYQHNTDITANTDALTMLRSEVETVSRQLKASQNIVASALDRISDDVEALQQASSAKIEAPPAAPVAGASSEAISQIQANIHLISTRVANMQQLAETNRDNLGKSIRVLEALSVKLAALEKQNADRAAATDLDLLVEDIQKLDSRLNKLETTAAAPPQQAAAAVRAIVPLGGRDYIISDCSGGYFDGQSPFGGNLRWIIIGSRMTIWEAEAFAAPYGFSGLFILRDTKGVFAIAFPAEVSTAASEMNRLKSNGMIPNDAFVSLGQSYRAIKTWCKK